MNPVELDHLRHASRDCLNLGALLIALANSPESGGLDPALRAVASFVNRIGSDLDDLTNRAAE